MPSAHKTIFDDKELVRSSRNFFLCDNFYLLLFVIIQFFWPKCFSTFEKPRVVILTPKLTFIPKAHQIISFLPNLSKKYNLFVSTSPQTQSRLTEQNELWMRSYAQSKYFGSLTIVYDEPPKQNNSVVNLYDCLIVQMNRLELYFNSLEEHWWRVKDNGCPFGVPGIKRMIAISEYAVARRYRWSIKMDDDCYVAVNRLHFLEEDLDSRPDPYTHLIQLGSCVDFGGQVTFLQGGGGTAYSYYMMFFFKQIEGELYRLLVMCEDWEIPYWSKKVGIPSNETSSNSFIGYIHYYVKPIRSDIQKCPEKGESNRCSFGNGIFEMAKYVFFHNHLKNAPLLLKAIKTNDDTPRYGYYNGNGNKFPGIDIVCIIE